MAVQDWWDAPEIHPSQIKVGDIIGTTQPSGRRCTVRLIGGPQKAPAAVDIFQPRHRGPTAHGHVQGERL